MKFKALFIFAILSTATFLFSGCHKPTSTSTTTTTANSITTNQVFNTEANVVIEANYIALVASIQSLYTALVQMQNTPTANNLTNCRNLWLNAATVYEQCESFNFGPTLLNGDDPNINGFPIDTNLVDTLLKGNTVFTQANVSNLPQNFKGLHCIEFELYGSGNKTISQFTSRQFNYMDSLALNIQAIAFQLDSAWNPSVPGNYNKQFVTAGNGSNTYTSQKQALEDLVINLGNYCEIDEQTKINNPFNSNAAQQESPFANNTVADIVNNLIGIQNCYLGQYGSVKGPGFSAFISQSNKALDNKIKNDLTAAINAVSNITPNFSQALTSNRTAIQNAKNICDTLDLALKGSTNSLYSYINQNVK